MNPHMEEILLEEHRRDMKRDVNNIHLQALASKGRVYHPNLFTHAMQNFGQWLIVRGEGLVKRYEVPAKKRQSSKKSYAQ